MHKRKVTVYQVIWMLNWVHHTAEQNQICTVKTAPGLDPQIISGLCSPGSRAESRNIPPDDDSPVNKIT
jgi:hypothetical protein